MPLSVSGGEFEASRPVPPRSISPCSSLSNRQSSGVCSSVPVNLIGQSSVPAEVSVEKSVQFDGRALKSGRAPCEAPPRHSVVFLFHRFRFFLIFAGPMPWCTNVHPRHPAVEWCSDHQDRLDEALTWPSHAPCTVSHRKLGNLLAMARVSSKA